MPSNRHRSFAPALVAFAFLYAAVPTATAANINSITYDVTGGSVTGSIAFLFPGSISGGVVRYKAPYYPASISTPCVTNDCMILTYIKLQTDPFLRTVTIHGSGLPGTSATINPGFFAQNQPAPAGLVGGISPSYFGTTVASIIKASHFLSATGGVGAAIQILSVATPSGGTYTGTISTTVGNEIRLPFPPPAVPGPGFALLLPLGLTGLVAAARMNRRRRLV